ncbi:MAG: glycosyltransferase [Thermoguttaceae bacterium]|nr:glycosyltransferase [Thermoguttaceae bacterium]
MSTNAPKVSIIVPVYNVEKYLRECLDSICGQTMREIEIICVDDGATDSSGAILDEYAARDARIQVIHKQNGGLASARNAGMKSMTGKYVLFVDSDDYISPTLCEHAFQKAEETGAEMTLFHHALDENGKICPLDFKNNSFLGTGPLGNLKAFFELGPNVWKTLWKRAFLEEFSMSYHEDTQWEDAPFTSRGAFLARKVALLPETHYFYRSNPDSLMRASNSPNFSLFNVKAFNYAWNDIQNESPAREVKAFLLTQKLIFVYYGYTHSASKFLKTFRRNIREGVLPGELEMLRAGELDVLPLIRYFFLSIYGNRKERLNGKLRLFKFHVIRWIERTFHVRIYPEG